MGCLRCAVEASRRRRRRAAWGVRAPHPGTKQPCCFALTPIERRCSPRTRRPCAPSAPPSAPCKCSPVERPAGARPGLRPAAAPAAPPVFVCIVTAMAFSSVLCEWPARCIVPRPIIINVNRNSLRLPLPGGGRSNARLLWIAVSREPLPACINSLPDAAVADRHRVESGDSNAARGPQARSAAAGRAGGGCTVKRRPWNGAALASCCSAVCLTAAAIAGNGCSSRATKRPQ